MALDIKVPVNDLICSEKDLITTFLQLTPKLLTYFLSFVTMGIYWLVQSTQFHYISKSDRSLNWIKNTKGFLETVPISKEDKEKIAYRNAEKLLKLKV